MTSTHKQIVHKIRMDRNQHRRQGRQGGHGGRGRNFKHQQQQQQQRNREQRPNYIQRIISFNRQQLHFQSSGEAANYFVNICNQVIEDPNHHQNFNAQLLAMLFVGAKKYRITFQQWQYRANSVWHLLHEYSQHLNPQATANILNSLQKKRLQ